MNGWLRRRKSFRQRGNNSIVWVRTRNDRWISTHSCQQPRCIRPLCPERTVPDQDASIGFDELKQRHAAMACQLPAHRQIGDCIVRTEHSKGPFHELPLYSYQRDRMKPGKPIAQPGRIRNASDVHVYHFDAGDRIVRVDVGNGLQQFQSHYVVQHPLGFSSTATPMTKTRCPPASTACKTAC